MAEPARILLVEDEPLIAMMLEDVLETLGHSVAAVCDSVAGALARLGDGGIDAAILDVNLRGGEQSWPVADALADRGIPFVLASGGGKGDRPARHMGVPALPKPFGMADVQRALGL